MADIFSLFGSIGVKNNDAIKGLKEVDTQVNKTDDNIKNKSSKMTSNLGSTMTKVGGIMMSVATVIGAGAVKMFVPFDETMAKISTLVSDTKVLEGIKKDMQVMSNELGIDANQIGNAIYDGLSSGVSEENIADFTKKMAKLAKGGMTEIGVATDLTTTILNSYGLEISETDKIMDKLIQTQNRGKVTVNELGSDMGKVIPTANAYGVNLDNIASAYAIMTAKGVRSAESTTYLNSALNEMGKSGTISSKAIKDMSGKTFPELIKSGKSLGDVFGDMDKYAKANNLSLADMFGSAEGGKAALLLSAEGGKAFNRELEMMIDSSGMAEEAFNKMDNTLKARIDKTIQKLKNTFIKLGEAILPLIENKIVPAIEKFATWMSNLDEKAIENMASWVEWGVKLGGVLLIGGNLLGFVGKISSGVSVLSGIMGSTGIATGGLGSAIGGLGGSLGLLLNPVTLIVGAIAGIGIALVANEKKIQKSTDEISNMGVSLEDFDGKLRTSDNLWTTIFGKNIEFKFSEGLKTESQKMEEQVAIIIGKYQELDKAIEEIQADNNKTQEEKAQEIKDMWVKVVDEQKAKIEEQSKTLGVNIEGNANALKDNLINVAGLSGTFALEQAEVYKRFAQDQLTTIQDNETQKLEILTNAQILNRDLSITEKETLKKLEEDSAIARINLLEMTAEDIRSIMEKENLDAYISRNENTANLMLTNEEKLNAMREHTAGKLSEIDKQIKKVKDMNGVSEEDKKAELVRLKIKSDALNLFGLELDRRMTSNSNSYTEFGVSAQNTMIGIRRDLESGAIDAYKFSTTNEGFMLMAMQSFVDAGLGAGELEKALNEIPLDIRPNVIAKIDGKNNAEALKQAIDNLKDKTVTVNMVEKRAGGQSLMYAKGTEGVYSNTGNMQRALVGEQGAEMVELPRGAKVKTHRETKNATRDEMIPIIIKLDGKTIANVTAKYLPSALGNRNRQTGFGGV